VPFLRLKDRFRKLVPIKPSSPTVNAPAIPFDPIRA
jgi:hypothetical protein